MATMTLQYDAHSKVARTRINEMLSWGVFSIVEPKKEQSKEAQFAQEFRTALQHGKDYKEGRMQFRNVEDLLREL